MRPPEKKHLIQAKRVVNNIEETSEIDIRITRWQKINSVWVNEAGWSPMGKESISKIEDWVDEISSIIPTKKKKRKKRGKEEDNLDNQLSAVEGHKKIEIEETKDTWNDPVVEEVKEEPHIGEELETEPWINRAKTLVGLLLGAIIAIFIIYSNKPYVPKTQSPFVKEELTKLNKGPWSKGKTFPTIGKVYLYNTDWNNIEATDFELKQVLITLLDEFNEKKLDTLTLSEKEEIRRIEEIIQSKRPLIIFVPHEHSKTRLWVSRAGGIIKESYNNKGDLSWEFLKSNKIQDIPFLIKK
jgi:hypothetical protein